MQSAERQDAQMLLRELHLLQVSAWVLEGLVESFGTEGKEAQVYVGLPLLGRPILSYAVYYAENINESIMLTSSFLS